jgi:nucleoside-diphosphate-sugar epimerase
MKTGPKWPPIDFPSFYPHERDGQTNGRNAPAEQEVTNMKIALTGGSGGLGRAIAEKALHEGHQIVSIDLGVPEGATDTDDIRFVAADVCDYEQLVAALASCDALIHMAAIAAPGRHPDHVIHNTNVVGSYNALHAAVEHKITRICQASSVNAIGLAFSRAPRFDYFPIDENHPNYVEEPYSLSKWICEQQADAFARRHANIAIASMRFHLVVPERAAAAEVFGAETEAGRKQLWAYTRFDAAAKACLLSLEAKFTGHESFYITAPDTSVDVPSLELAARYYPQVPVTGDLDGYRSFFSATKAKRLLGWTHPDHHEASRSDPVQKDPG